MHCPACGAEALAGDRFCRGCGRELGQPAAPAATPAAAAAPVRRPAWLTGSSLALLLMALILLLAGTNPSPDAYVAWAADRLSPSGGAAYYAVARATVADSYGVCTVFRTEVDGGPLVVLGILDRFVPLSPVPAPAPAQPRRRYRRRNGGVQI
jgi:hypothetical protein